MRVIGINGEERSVKLELTSYRGFQDTGEVSIYEFNRIEELKNIKKNIINFNLEENYEEISRIAELFFLNSVNFKNDINILEIILNANIINNLHFENVNIFKKHYKNIDCDSKAKKRLMILFSTSLIKENRITEVIPIFKALKKFDDKYRFLYINCLMKEKLYDESFIELKKFFPECYHHKIFKELSICEILFNSNSEKLSKQITKTRKIFQRYRIVHRDLPENKIFYKLGIFSLHICDKINAIKNFNNSASIDTEIESDKIYKYRSIKKLEELSIKFPI